MMKNHSLPARILRRFRYMLFPSLLGAWLMKLGHPLKTKFVCPICSYHGPFRDDSPSTGGRTPHSHCPRCGSNVRARLQYLVMERLRERVDLSVLTIHHFSPEKFFVAYFRGIFGNYLSAGLTDKPVDCPADLTDLPFPDHSCDVIFGHTYLNIFRTMRRQLQRLQEY